MVARADLNIVLKATDRASPSIKNLQSTIIRFVGAVSAALAGLTAVAFPVKTQLPSVERPPWDAELTARLGHAPHRFGVLKSQPPPAQIECVPDGSTFPCRKGLCFHLNTSFRPLGT